MNAQTPHAQPRGNLRPPIDSDRERLFMWRNSEDIRRYMLHDQPIAWDEHCAWFERLRERHATLFFVFELEGVPAGTVHFTDVDRVAGVAHWGFYVDPSRSRTGVGAAMGYLALSHAIFDLGLRRIDADVLEFNDRSISFHRKLGFQLMAVSPREYAPGRGRMLVFELRDEEWRAVCDEVRSNLIQSRPEFSWLPARNSK